MEALLDPDLSPHALIVVDADGKIVKANEKADRMFGYSPGEMVSLCVEDLIPIEAREKHRQHRALYASLPRARMMGIGLRVSALKKDGSTFNAEIALSPLMIDAGHMLTIAIVRDVTPVSDAVKDVTNTIDTIRDIMNKSNGGNGDGNAGN